MQELLEEKWLVKHHSSQGDDVRLKLRAPGQGVSNYVCASRGIQYLKVIPKEFCEPFLL